MGADTCLLFKCMVKVVTLADLCGICPYLHELSLCEAMTYMQLLSGVDKDGVCGHAPPTELAGGATAVGEGVVVEEQSQEASHRLHRCGPTSNVFHTARERFLENKIHIIYNNIQ